MRFRSNAKPTENGRERSVSSNAGRRLYAVAAFTYQLAPHRCGLAAGLDDRFAIRVERIRERLSVRKLDNDDRSIDLGSGDLNLTELWVFESVIDVDRKQKVLLGREALETQLENVSAVLGDRLCFENGVAAFYAELLKDFDTVSAAPRVEDDLTDRRRQVERDGGYGGL